MKILQLHGGLIRDGGEEMFVLNMLRQLDPAKASVDCLVVEDCENEAYTQCIRAHAGEVYALHIPLHATKFANHIYKPVCSFLREHRYDLVHIHSSSIAALAVLAAAAKKSGVPRVLVHSHSVGRADSPEHRLFRFLASLAMGPSVDVYCACSHAAAAWKFEPRYAEQAVILKNGIDTARFRYDESKRAAMRRELQLDENAFVIGNVGRLCEVKNQAFLLDVFALLRARIPDAVLLLVGDGEDGERLRSAVQEKGLADCVIFTGAVGNVQDYLNAMDIFAFVSLYEGLGIAAIEAQCAGLPVVASKGVPEEIRLTDNVVFLDVGGEDACRIWADKIESLRAFERTDGAQTVKNAGYDLCEAGRQLERLYFGA